MEHHGSKHERVTSFPESDYRFGVGTLRMRVERVDWQHPMTYDEATWYEVVGVEVTEDGRDIARRRTLVRSRSLGTLRALT